MFFFDLDYLFLILKCKDRLRIKLTTIFYEKTLSTFYHYFIHFFKLF